MEEIFKSRFFVKSDRKLTKYQSNSYEWDFEKLNWYSMLYEYVWALDCIKIYFEGKKDINVIDFATGGNHPFPLMLREFGFNKVISTDTFSVSEWQYKKYINEKFIYSQGDLRKDFVEKADCVICISVLEHINEKGQVKALENIINHINRGGCLILTFDFPGYDYITDPLLYFKVLELNNMKFEKIFLSGDKIFTENKKQLEYKTLAAFWFNTMKYQLNPALNEYREVIKAPFLGVKVIADIIRGRRNRNPLLNCYRIFAQKI